MDRRYSVTNLPGLVACICVLLLCLSACSPFLQTEAAVPQHIVILGDPHLPGREPANKNLVRTTINSWKDVSLIIAVGDICAEFGSDDEYRAAHDYFAGFEKPVLAVAGNHDYFYATPEAAPGKLIEGSALSKEAKLQLFKTTFNLKEYFFSRRLGNFFFIFLSTDSHQYLSGLSDRQLTWLRQTLAAHQDEPTVIVFHGPLNRTLRDYRGFINTPNFIAQPVAAIDDIITANPQIFLWVSGHTHTPPLEESFASPVNLYKGQVTNIHNKDMNRGTIWTNSLFLYPDRIVIRTFTHQEYAWLPQLERTVYAPHLHQSDE